MKIITTLGVMGLFLFQILALLGLVYAGVFYTLTGESGTGVGYFILFFVVMIYDEIRNKGG